MADTFTADVSRWADELRDVMDLVLKSAAQDVVAVAQRTKAKGGRMPVDTGKLRNSLTTSLEGSTSLTGPEGYTAVLSNMELGDVAQIGWTAEYAAAVEFGAQGRPPAFFARGAVQEWERIVHDTARRFATSL